MHDYVKKKFRKFLLVRVETRDLTPSNFNSASNPKKAPKHPRNIQKEDGIALLRKRSDPHRVDAERLPGRQILPHAEDVLPASLHVELEEEGDGDERDLHVQRHHPLQQGPGRGVLWIGRYRQAAALWYRSPGFQ